MSSDNTSSKDNKSKSCQYCSTSFSTKQQRIAHEEPCAKLSEYNQLFGTIERARQIMDLINRQVDTLEDLLKKHKVS